MRILLVDMWGGRNFDLGYQISAALKHHGHEVRIFDYRKFKLQHFSFTNKWLNARLVSAAKNWPADLVLVNKGESILPGTIEAIGKAGIKTANWNPDEPFGEIQAFNAIKNLAEYDACFNYDLQYVPRMQAVNPHSYHLPPGADPFEVHAERIPLAETRNYVQRVMENLQVYRARFDADVAVSKLDQQRVTKQEAISTPLSSIESLAAE